MRLTFQTQTGNRPLGQDMAPNHPFSPLGTIFGLPHGSALPATASANQHLGSAPLWFGFFSLSYGNGPWFGPFSSSFIPCPSHIDAVTWRIREQSWRRITVIPGMVTYAYNPSTFLQEAEEEL